MKRVRLLVTLLTPLMGLEPALVANSFCPGQEKHTMHRPEIQVGNSS